MQNAERRMQNETRRLETRRTAASIVLVLVVVLVVGRNGDDGPWTMDNAERRMQNADG